MVTQVAMSGSGVIDSVGPIGTVDTGGLLPLAVATVKATATGARCAVGSDELTLGELNDRAESAHTG